MKTTPDVTLNAAEAFGLVSKYRRLVLTTSTLVMALFVMASFALPKKYKCHFSLTIYAKYFQNPLVRDFIQELSDPGEMKAQRQSLIRQALTPEFLDTLGDKYGIYHLEKDPDALPAGPRRVLSYLKALGERAGLRPSPQRAFQTAAAREALLARIQVFDLNNTTFHVSFIYSDPEVTFQVTRDIYAQVIRTLLEAHVSNLVTIRDAIRKRLESLAFNMTASPDPRVAVRPQIVREELSDIRSQIQALLTQFTEDHPVIKELRGREKILSRWEGSSSESSPAASSGQGNVLVGAESQESVKDIYNDLMKKMNYLNIALEADRAHQGDYFATFESPLYPEAPVWPKRGLMALWGLALGFIGSLSLAALREYFDRTTLHTAALAEQLGIPLLGEIPGVPWNTSLPMENRK